MSRNHDSNSTARSGKHSIGLIGVALAGGLILSQSAFAVQPLAQGYLASASHAAKAGEGKCGEGKCGEESFAKTDTNHDHKVSRAEFVAAAPTRAAEFDRIDTDKNGSISLPEALKSVEASRRAAGKEVGEGKCGEGKCGGQA
ncbi:HvfA family oxazolone/thioamide-modified RiPP metallophore [Pseudomonas sp. CGJS7]|uniref:HvfA family oxazolone/thioamide-modified RiPP metallophore n=1 Tax=Pseudomonas sp. CGJS7 TaxID=3109348 RepID=UPI00300AAB20